MADVKQYITCEERVWNGWSLHRCSRRSKVERNGKHYCGIHDPVRVAEKDAARKAKWDAERKASHEIYRRETAVENLCADVSTDQLEALGKGWVKLVLDSIEKAGYFGF
jgi:hypothetical protein